MARGYRRIRGITINKNTSFKSYVRKTYQRKITVYKGAEFKSSPYCKTVGEFTFNKGPLNHSVIAEKCLSKIYVFYRTLSFTYITDSSLGYIFEYTEIDNSPFRVLK